MLEDPPLRQAPARASPARNTTALLGLAYMSLGHRIVDGVIAAGFPQRPAHSAVMAHIDIEGGTRLTTIAARANITPQAVGELVDDLERLGYVVRQPDPDDRRAKRIVLTERGEACVAAALSTIAALEAELEDLLGSTALALLHDMLGRISTAGGRSGDPR
jgi:DNA-binding MarR family transcriptional regulator